MARVLSSCLWFFEVSRPFSASQLFKNRKTFDFSSLATPTIVLMAHFCNAALRALLRSWFYEFVEHLAVKNYMSFLLHLIAIGISNIHFVMWTDRQDAKASLKLKRCSIFTMNEENELIVT